MGKTPRDPAKCKVEGIQELGEALGGAERGQGAGEPKLGLGSVGFEALEELSSEDLGEGLDAEEELLRARDPGRAIEGERSARDQAAGATAAWELRPGFRLQRYQGQVYVFDVAPS